jgi:hypothetical protein
MESPPTDPAAGIWVVSPRNGRFREATAAAIPPSNMATTSFTSVRNEADRPGPILHQLARHDPRAHLLDVGGASRRKARHSILYVGAHGSRPYHVIFGVGRRLTSRAKRSYGASALASCSAVIQATRATGKAPRDEDPATRKPAAAISWAISRAACCLEELP